jgi:hypothetical protein
MIWIWSYGEPFISRRQREINCLLEHDKLLMWRPRPISSFAAQRDADYSSSMLNKFRGIIILVALAAGPSLRADEVVMQNGDKLTGTIQTVTPAIVVLENDNLGTLTFPRAKVATVTFGPGTNKPAATTTQLPATPSADAATPTPASAQTNSAADSSGLRGIRDQTNLVQQVASQYLAPAGPDAMAKFNEMLDGLSTGKIDMNELRKQAQAAVDQLRELKKTAGSDADSEADTYLVILEQFLKETAPTNSSANPIGASSATNAPSAAIAPAVTNAPAATNPSTTSN